MARIDPHSYTDTAQGVIASVLMRLTVDFGAKSLSGEATLTFRQPVEGPLDLDTRDLRIDGARTKNGEAVPFDLGERDPVLGSRLRLTLPSKTREVTISYATSPTASALQWLEPAHTAGGKHPYLFSQCQPHHARSVVPLQDSASVRFPYHAEITVPSALVAVMSAAPGEKRPGPRSGTATYSFEMPQPIPSYLLALAVGDIASKDVGPRSRVYAEPATLERAAWEFGEVDSMLRKAEALFGPYRWDRYDFLVMPPAFPYGGMENPRLTFLTPTLLAGDRSLVNVLAHELAHSWTGNLVTNATMNDFWLNEGFTVWAERRILETLAGQEAVALGYALGRQELQEEIERFGVTSPYTQLRTDLGGVDPDEVYSQVPYEKGCLFVTLLEQSVGRERFDRFITSYMDRFAFQSITTEQFVTFLKEALPEVDGKVDLQRWIYAPGIPEDAPAFHAPQLDVLLRLAAGWARGERPNVEQARGWSIDAWLVYLGALPKKIEHTDLRWLDEHFHMLASGNAEILCKFLVLAASSAYEPAYAKLREFVGGVGRMKYLKPLYKALWASDATRPLARKLFEAYADHYHPIARAGLESIMKAS